ncbi:MAG: helix-turn-helix domain-containing protein [Desulfovibrio sp.]|jgi:DNA-binding XRE family transcriptional regulator|nr:helix-turn-helix domain-containing protein [Desulfovibrio sp.]
MLAHMKTRHTEQDAEIVLTVPSVDGERVSNAILCMLELAGHKVRQVNDEGEELYTVEEVFPEAHPGMALNGFRLKMEMTQNELAEKLGISQNRVSDMETGKRPISKRMAERLSELFDVPGKAFL